MSRVRISDELRELVATRANGLCEYCLIDEASTYWSCHVDHIISVKHGGPTTEDNLAYACIFCNRFKGSDIGSVISDLGHYVRFFNPREDPWHDHFALEETMRISSLTEVGMATERILRFNAADRLLERRTLNQKGRYPTDEAKELIRGLSG